MSTFCKILLCFLLLFVALSGKNQEAPQKRYTTANAHSHNDYEQAIPFHKAWQKRFGSVEADIFLRNGKLIVAHDTIQIARQWTLDSLYIGPLLLQLEKNGGFVYPDKKRSLQLMIDIKSEAISTLDRLVQKIKAYPSLTKSTSLKIVISGSRPDPEQFASYPSWILFDGELRREYQPKELEKIVMLSDNFARYSSWKGQGALPEKDRQNLKEMIDKAHQLNKKVRFWNAPDTPEAWKIFMELGVDYINTDKIEELSTFLK
jgi:alkaline phosphatase